MAWSQSGVSGAMLANLFSPAQAISWASDTIKVAFYNNTPTPNPVDTFANNSYNAGQWVTANELYQSGQWAQGGVALSGKTDTFSAPPNPASTQLFQSGLMILNSGITSSGNSCTLSGVYGCLVYDASLAADSAFCWNYFGSAQEISSGTLSLAWSGILQFIYLPGRSTRECLLRIYR